MKVNNKKINSKLSRDINFELLRIVAMLMVVCIHFNGYGKILSSVVYPSNMWFIANIIEFAVIIAVNLYVLITGYYMIKTDMKLKKIIQLYLKIMFYSLGIYLVLIYFRFVIFDKKELIKLLFPITTERYWFMTTYMGLYLIIPYLNKLANNLNKLEYKNFLIISTILLSGVKTIYPDNNIFSSLSGFTLTWFVYLYLLGGYIRNYYDKKNNKFILALFYIFLIVIQVEFKIYITNNVTNSGYINHILGYDNLIVLVESVVLFLFFKNINIKNEIINKIILFISPLTIGVYLIHEHVMFRSILWNQICKPYVYLSGGGG